MQIKADKEGFRRILALHRSPKILLHLFLSVFIRVPELLIITLLTNYSDFCILRQ